MTTHSCPGCGRAGIPVNLLACRPCWFRLPIDLRRPVTATFRRDNTAHLDAVIAALDWYADNPGHRG